MTRRGLQTRKHGPPKWSTTWHDVPFRRVHELDIIGGHCVDIDPTLKDLAERADTLPEYAWQFRYPGAPYEPVLEEGQRALALAREVAEAVSSRLPSEVQP